MDDGGKQRWNKDNERTMYRFKMIGREIVVSAMHKTNYVNEQILSLQRAHRF